MKILTSSHLLALLMDGNAKCILVGKSPCVIPISVFYAYEGGDDATIIISNEIDTPTSNKDMVEIDRIPQSLWLIWSEHTSPLMQMLTAWIDKHQAYNNTLTITGAADILMENMLNLSLKRHHAMAVNMRELQKMYFLQQELLEELQAQRGMQDVLTELNTLTMRFNAPPSEKITIRTLTDTPLKQYLPIRTQGVVGMDIFLPRSSQSIKICLIAAETDEVLAQWHTVSYASGWVTFWWPALLARDYYGIYIAVSSSDGTEVAHVSLAETTSSRLALPDAPNAMLALRLWMGKAGNHYANEDASSRAIQLSERALKHIKPAADITVSYNYLQYYGHGRILLHPVRHEMTAAIIEEDLPESIQKISCYAAIENPRCQAIVRVRVIIAEKSANYADILEDKGILSDSGWSDVARTETRYLIEAQLPRAVDAYKLFLMSFIPAGQNPYYAHLVFSDIRITQGVTSVYPD
jgi:hypothetical protein